MALDLEYLEEAVVEAAAAAEWYAVRSATAAAGFEAELADAESAIRSLPSAWPPLTTERADTYCGDIRSVWCIESNPHGSSSSLLPTVIAGPRTGAIAREPG